MRLRRDARRLGALRPGPRRRRRLQVRDHGPRRRTAAAEGRPLGFAPSSAPRQPPRSSAELGGFDWSDEDGWRARARADPRRADRRSTRCISARGARAGGGRPFLTYRELAEQLVPYVATSASPTSSCCRSPSTPSTAPGATSHRAISRRPAASARPTTSAASSTAATQPGSACILDWVPAHFPTDAHGLGRFDGTALYEHADPRQGLHHDWDTLIFNYGRHEVRNFLVAQRALLARASSTSTACASMPWPRCSTSTTAAQAGDGCRTGTAAARTSRRSTSCAALNEIVYGEYARAR